MDKSSVVRQDPFSDSRAASTISSVSDFNSDIFAPPRSIEHPQQLYRYKSYRLRGEYVHLSLSYLCHQFTALQIPTAMGTREEIGQKQKEQHHHMEFCLCCGACERLHQLLRRKES
jgi:hypothetical protein